MSRIIELRWDCGDCSSRGILGRHKRCPSCGSPREKGEMRMSGLNTDRDGDGYNDAQTVTDPDLIRLAKAGADWFCTHCGAGNIGSGDRCDSCGAPRYGEAGEDHLDFAGDHKRVGRRGKERRLEVESPPNVEDPEPKPDPSEDYAEQRRQGEGRIRMFALGGGVLLLTAILIFVVWAFQTHDVEGTVSKMTWSQNTIHQRWTPVTVRLWQHETQERSEIPPTQGSGERAGMTLIGGCSQEHHHYEKYQCGTRQESYDCSYSESYQGTCSRSESYACGETCRDKGNGFATCSTRYCSRQVTYSCTKSRRIPKTCERTVPKYCDRSIKKTRCDYLTQEWRKIQTLPASGLGKETRWMEPEVGPLDRLRYTADYTVYISYTDLGKDHVYEHKPVKTKEFLGGYAEMPRREALAAEKKFQEWGSGDPVTVVVNNLGGVHEIQREGERLSLEVTRTASSP